MILEFLQSLTPGQQFALIAAISVGGMLLTFICGYQAGKYSVLQKIEEAHSKQDLQKAIDKIPG